MKRACALLLALWLLCISVFAAGSFLDGVYYGMGRGRNGWISVSVAVQGGCIASVEVDAPQETPSKLGQAMAIVQSLLGLGDLESIAAVDAVSGATASSEGIKSAVLNALQGAVPAWLHGQEEPCPGAAFSDLPPYGSWAHAPIDWATATGITSGTTPTTFSPDAPCTRAQIVTFLWRAYRGAEGEAPAGRTALQNPFSDVPETAYYYSAVLWAVERGITKGTSDTRFSPDAPCTRAQAVTLLWRAVSENADAPTRQFADVPETAYYAQAVRWAIGQGITNGTTETTFSPNAACTRAQIVTFLYRAK